MMSPEKKLRARKNATQVGVGGTVGLGAREMALTAPVTQPASDDDTLGGLKEILLGQFDQALNGQTLDREVRDTLMAQFRMAVESAGGDASSGAGADASALDLGAWSQAVRNLQASDALPTDEANHLIRQLEHAFSPQRHKQSRIALEFGQRLHEEGQERALAWFMQASKEAEQEGPRQGSAVPVADTQREPAVALRGDVTESRSRRLRAPPRAGRS